MHAARLLICLIPVFLLPATALSRVSLSDEELCTITAQAPGDPTQDPNEQDTVPVFSLFTLTEELFDSPYSRLYVQFDLDIETGFDTLYYEDPDETAFATAVDGYFHMTFTAEGENGLLVTSGAMPSSIFPNDPEKTRIRVEMRGIEARLIEGRIGAITIGTAPGEGPSLGSLAFGNGTTIISGTFEVWPNP